MKTEQQRTIDWSHLLDEALTAPGNLHGAYSRFHDYSFGNCLLLFLQGCEGPVATYKRWESLGRHVLKGAKAKEILRPITIKREPEHEGDEPRTFTRFKLVKAIFDYKDTAGDELPPFKAPEWDLDHALTNLDIKRVPFQHFDGNTAGYSFERNVAINPVAPYPFKTMLHEVAHIQHGHTTGTAATEYTAHRGLCEFEAEGSAYLSGHEIGIQTAEDAEVSRAYIQGWLRGQSPPESSVRRVFTVTDQILRAGRMAIEASTEGAA